MYHPHMIGYYDVMNICILLYMQILLELHLIFGDRKYSEIVWNR